MINKKKFIVKTSLFCLLSFVSSVFAPNIALAAVSKELPKLELPEQKPLDTPTLSKDKDSLIDKLKEKGFGKRNKGPLKMPEAKTPEGTGKKADEKFKTEIGDMWKEKKLDKTDPTPKDEFFKSFIDDFEKENNKELNSQKSKDDINKYNKKLDTSNLYDLDSIKAKNSVSDSTTVPDCPKPKGWGSENKNAPSGLQPLPNPQRKGRFIFPPIFIKKKKKKDDNNNNNGGKKVKVPNTAPSKVRVRGKIPSFIPIPTPSKEKKKAPTPHPVLQPQMSYSARAKKTWDKVKKPLAGAGLAAAGAYIGYKAIKGVVGFCVGGPVGAAVGVLSP